MSIRTLVELAVAWTLVAFVLAWLWHKVKQNENDF